MFKMSEIVGSDYAAGNEWSPIHFCNEWKTPKNKCEDKKCKSDLVQKDFQNNVILSKITIEILALL